MSAKIISVVNQKGGSGKTTISMLLSAQLAEMGNKVLIIDADPQNSAIPWYAQAMNSTPYPATCVDLSGLGKNIHQGIREHIDNYDYIFVDCPPSIENPQPQSSLIISDFALVPAIPSIIDIRATTGIKKLIDNASIVNPELRSAILKNCVQKGTNMDKAITKLLENFELDIFDSEVGLRTAYKEAAALGKSITGLSDNKAKIEIRDLALELIEKLKG
jgi:chromosome partitioning protein